MAKKPAKRAPSKKGALIKKIEAPPVKYNEEEVKKLRKMIRKKDGTFFSKSYYQKISKSIKGKNQNEVDDIIISLRKKNPNLRYFVESNSETLHFQTGNFIERVTGEAETSELKGRKVKKSERPKSNKIKKGTKASVIDLKGDEIEFNSPAHALDVISEQNKIINRVIDRIDRETKRKKGKSLGVYVTVPEKEVSNSEGQLVSIQYNFRDLKVHGFNKSLFWEYIEEEMG